MNALIFGVNSQDGFYLSIIFELNNIKTVGVSRSDGNWMRGDVCDKDFVFSIIKSIKPKYIVHLAAISTTNHNALFENHEIISTGTLNILEAVKNFSPNSKVFITGSGVQFKNKGCPIDENTNFEANSSYSVARIQSVYAARYYRQLGFSVYVGYLFHHESYLRKSHHVSKKITETVSRIKDGSNEKLIIGDPNVTKEWTFAGDVASAIFCLLKQDNVFEVCIGSGLTYSIQDWIEICFGLVNIDWRKHLVVEENFKSEYLTLISNPKLIKSLGWQISTDINMLAYKMINRLL